MHSPSQITSSTVGDGAGGWTLPLTPLTLSEGIPEALHLHTGKNRKYLAISSPTSCFSHPSCLPRLPEGPAVTLWRPGSPSTSHERHGCCVPQDVEKREGPQGQAAALRTGQRRGVPRRPRVKCLFLFQAWVFWVVAQTFTEHFNSDPRGATVSVAAWAAAA